MNKKTKAFLLVISSLWLVTMSFSHTSAESPKNPENSSPEVDSESGVYYTVKKGDTLWDLSKRFNSDAWKWPGIWSDNQPMTNPHLIYPGQKIKLFYRSDMDTLKKIHAESLPAPGRPTGSVGPVKMSGGIDTASSRSSGIALPHYHYSKIGSVGFMRNNPAEAHGYIFKIKGTDHLMINKGDEVFIKDMNDKPIVPGAKYFCYTLNSPSKIKSNVKEGKKLSKLDRKTKSTEVGYQHYITGVIQIMRLESGYALGTVIQSYRPISVDDFLVPYTLRSPDIPLAAGIEGMSGAIIASEEGESLFGDDKIAFIDKGSKDGIEQGQMYNVFYPEEKSSSKIIGGKKLFVPVDFASFIVLVAEENMSTVLITSAYEGISAGDEWHYPQD